MSEADGIREESCSSIRKNQVPQPSTDTNSIILKVLFAVAEAMHQNVVALHATDRMLDKDADLTSHFMRRLLRFAQWRTRIFCTLARLLVRHGNLLSTVGRLHTLITSIHTYMAIGKPIDIWR